MKDDLNELVVNKCLLRLYQDYEIFVLVGLVLKEFSDYPAYRCSQIRSFKLEHDLQNSCKNKNKESRDKNREPRIPKDSAHAEPGYKNPNQIRTANHPLKENCERQERWRERTRSLKDGFSTHESLSPPSLMLGLHLSLFIMELIKPFCFI